MTIGPRRRSRTIQGHPQKTTGSLDAPESCFFALDMHSLLLNIFHIKCSQCTVRRNPGPGEDSVHSRNPRIEKLTIDTKSIRDWSGSPRNRFCNTTPNAGVVRWQTAFLEQFLNVSIGERKAQIPSDGANDNLGFEVSPFEQRRPRFDHGIDRSLSDSLAGVRKTTDSIAGSTGAKARPATGCSEHRVNQ